MKMIDTKLLDSSIWIAYIFDNKFGNLINTTEILLLSALSLFEIRKKMTKGNVPNREINEKIGYIKKRSLVIPVTGEIAENAANISIENNVPMADSIIYASALQNQAKVITLDNRFKKLKNVEVLKIE